MVVGENKILNEHVAKLEMKIVVTNQANKQLETYKRLLLTKIEKTDT